MNHDGQPLRLHPDVDEEGRGTLVQPRLYQLVRDLPVISPHGHVDPMLLRENQPFSDPATLLITPDHYVTRLLHANGVGLETLGVGSGPLSEKQAREAWHALCAHWDAYRGTPVRYWLEHQLADIFGVVQRPSAQTSDAIFDQIAGRLATPDYRPRALYQRFRISVLATSDDPRSDLSVHAALAADPSWSGRVVPTFRPANSPKYPTWIPATMPASCGPWNSDVACSSSMAPRRPTTATPTSVPTHSGRPRPAGSIGPR